MAPLAMLYVTMKVCSLVIHLLVVYTPVLLFQSTLLLGRVLRQMDALYGCKIQPTLPPL